MRFCAPRRPTVGSRTTRQAALAATRRAPQSRRIQGASTSTVVRVARIADAKRGRCAAHARKSHERARAKIHKRKKREIRHKTARQRPATPNRPKATLTFFFTRLVGQPACCLHLPPTYTPPHTHNHHCSATIMDLEQAIAAHEANSDSTSALPAHASSSPPTATPPLAERKRKRQENGQQ